MKKITWVPSDILSSETVKEIKSNVSENKILPKMAAHII